MCPCQPFKRKIELSFIFQIVADVDFKLQYYLYTGLERVNELKFFINRQYILLLFRECVILSMEHNIQ